MSKIIVSMMCFFGLTLSGTASAVHILACPVKSKCIVNAQLAENDTVLDGLIDKVAHMFSHPDALKDGTYGKHIYIDKGSKTGSVYPKNKEDIKGLRLDYEGATSVGESGNFQLRFGRGTTEGGCYASIVVPFSATIPTDLFKQAIINSVKTGVQQCIE